MGTCYLEVYLECGNRRNQASLYLGSDQFFGTWSGLRTLALNTNGAILFPNPSLQQVVTLSISVDVQFRQPQLSNTPTTFVSGRFFELCHDDDTSVDDLPP